MDQKLLCALIHQHLGRKNHPLVARLLQMSKPRRLPTAVLNAMVIHDYPINHVMARFTPVDCAQALQVAIENHKPTSVEFLLDFVSDSVNLVPLAQIALDNNNPPILDMISQSLSQNDKVSLLRRFCMRRDLTATKGCPPSHAAEILLKDTPSSELLNFAAHATHTPLFQKVCDDLLAVRQRRVLEQATDHGGVTRNKRKL